MKCPCCSIEIGLHRANRCLDSWVAENIMDRCGHILKKTQILELGSQILSNYHRCQKCGEEFWGLAWHKGYCAFPSYSTDIAAAWTVVEKMATNGWRLELDTKLLYQKEIRDYTASFERLVDDDIEVADVWAIKTAPLAICLAALKALGVETKDETG